MIERRPEAILLDAGNTLVFIDGPRLRDLLSRHGGDPAPERFARAEREARLRLARTLNGGTDDEGEVWRDYFLQIFSGVGVPRGAWAAAGDAVKAEHARAHLWSHVEPGTRAALATLRDRGYRLAVISNADGRVPGLLADVGLAPYFEFIIDSREVGVSKPDPRIFRMGTERMGVAPGRCLYVGDLYAVDVLGARAAGLNGLLVDPFDHFDVDAPRVPSVEHLPGALEAAPGGL